MASCNHEKRKTATEAKAFFRHSDSDERLIHEHGNEQIDKALTEGNWSIRGLSYKELCAAYDERIASIDANGNTNKRKDRVTLVSTVIPVPVDLPENRYLEWFVRVSQIYAGWIGEANFLEGHIHVDEVHDYLNSESGEWCKSRVHGHFYGVPERSEKLSARPFFHPNKMRALNSEVHEMSMDEFGVAFMDGTAKKSSKSVEKLKRESIEALKDREAGLEDREDALEADAKELWYQKWSVDKDRQSMDEKAAEIMHQAQEIQDRSRLHLLEVQAMRKSYEDAERHALDVIGKCPQGSPLSIVRAALVQSALYRTENKTIRAVVRFLSDERIVDLFDRWFEKNRSYDPKAKAEELKVKTRRLFDEAEELELELSKAKDRQIGR